MARKSLYDPKCYELAEAFLSDHPEKDTQENREALAAHIQREIEGEIEFILKPATPRVMGRNAT